jgi:prepilin-type N-terminal cleavage/methylation domain-containing protein
MKRLIIKNSSGFTLIELLIVVALLGLVIGPLMTFFSANYSTFLYESGTVEAQQVVRMGLDNIITNMRRAEQSSIERVSGSRIKMIVAKPRVVNNITIVDEIIYEYYLNNSAVYQKITTKDGAASNQLMNNISSFSVEEDNGVFTISTIVITDDVTQRDIEYSSSYTIRY